MERYYTPEQMAQFAELRTQTPPEEIEAVEREWTALLADVRASRGLDPASAEAKALCCALGCTDRADDGALRKPARAH